MPAEALALAVTAAVIHAGWNLLLAGARDSQAFAAIVLLVGGVIGAQIGGRVGAKLPGEQMRVLLAGLILFVAARLAYELEAHPADLYSAIWLSPEG